ncbi:hypothetical protein [Acetobacterium malicum]|uniref:hypothetical protein n=1 Tax=Acetobacterium malicum TaxID=52692 RepID=UPI00040D1A05|nr:hypothetical protein [Acetobacterium dehalogenans]
MNKCKNLILNRISKIWRYIIISLFSKHKKKKSVCFSVREQLESLAENIFNTYSFSPKQVIFQLDPEANIRTAYCNINMKPITIVVGIADYLNANTIDEAQKIYFQNSVLHECEHAKTQLLLPNTLKEWFNENKLSYGLWAFKLLDEYNAYSISNKNYKQDKGFLRGTEENILETITWYGQRHNISNAPLEKYYEYADSYYDLGTAFIAHKYVNNDFPTIKEENYLAFVSSYFNHLKEASEFCLTTCEEYMFLSHTLLEDFKLLIKCVQKINPTINISYDNFLRNSHMG